MSSQTNVYDELTLGVTNTLGKRQGVCDIQHKKSSPATKKELSKWEEKHMCMLPEELHNFYSTCNGLSITWNAKLSPGDGRIKVGRLWVNPLEELTRLTISVGMQNKVSLLDLDVESEEDHDDKPHFDHRSRAFELDPCDGYGKVCLVYRNTKTGVVAGSSEIWYLDRAVQWHYITDTFLNYFRLMLMYLGLPCWPTIYTDTGLPPQVQQWYHLYCPLRGNIYTPGKDSTSLDGISHQQTININPDKVFKSKPDKKKPALASSSATQPNAPANRKKPSPFSSATRPSTQRAERSQSQTSTKNYRY